MRTALKFELGPARLLSVAFEARVWLTMMVALDPERR
jgi:hypothetical protein